MRFFSPIIYLIIIDSFIILHPNLLAQENLPPLPDPYEVRLKWTLPQEQPYSKDSARISFQGGFYMPHHSSQSGYLIATQAAIPLSFHNKFFLVAGSYSSDIDYNKYRFYSGRIISSISIRASLLTNEFNLNRKSRVSTFYENIIASGSMISPIFLGEFNPKFDFRYARLFRHNHHDFFGLKFGNDYIIPTAIGNFNLATTIFLQSNVSTDWLIRLADNIIIKDFIFVKPKIDWQFFDHKLGLGADFGIRIGKIISILQIIINEQQIINFDSIYAEAGPLQINKKLHYPKNNWSAKTSIHFHSHEIDLSFCSFNYRINYCQADSLFYPENSTKRSMSINLNLKNKFEQIENRLGCKYNTGELSLIPIFHLSEQLTIKVKQFSFSLATEIIGKRYFENDDLEPNTIFNTEIVYHHSFFVVKIGCKNIFGTSWVFYPNYTDNHRKVLLEISILKTLW